MSLIERLISFFKTSPPLDSTSEAQQELSINRVDVEVILQMPITNLGLYEHALRHRSMIRNDPSRHLESNERLEFLGDAVLGLIIGEYLFHRFQESDEGFLTRTRAKLVNGAILAKYAKHIKLNEIVLISKNMEDSNGRNNATILSDAFEALLGALYLDQGYEKTRMFVLRVVQEVISIDDIVQLQSNYKSQLLEFVQARGWNQPEYELVEETGPSHQKKFKVQVLIQSKPIGLGTGYSKKQAEQRAAAEAMKHLNAN